MGKIGQKTRVAVTKRADAKILYVSVLFWSHILRDDKCGYLLVQKLFRNVEYFGRGDKLLGKNLDCQKSLSLTVPNHTL